MNDVDRLVAEIGPLAVRAFRHGPMEPRRDDPEACRDVAALGAAMRAAASAAWTRGVDVWRAAHRKMAASAVEAAVEAGWPGADVDDLRERLAEPPRVRLPKRGPGRRACASREGAA